MRYFWAVFLILGGAWGQKLRSREKCTGPNCPEKVEVSEEKPRRRSLRRAEARVDRYGYPKRANKAERFRTSTSAPEHSSIRRQESFSPYESPVIHRRRSERFRMPTYSARHKPLERQEAFQPYSPRIRHRRQAERHVLRAYRHQHRAYKRAERLALRESRRQQRALMRAERQRFQAYNISRSRRAERYTFQPKSLRHRRAPEGMLYSQRPIRHRQPSRSACEPPPPPRDRLTEKVSCFPPVVRHKRPEPTQTCQPPAIPHKNFDRYACKPPRLFHLAPKRYEQVACLPPPVPHKSFDRYSCSAPVIRHRLPEAYDVPCDAQRRGVMTATERFAHDLRYLFTRHKKHCQLVSAYSGVSISEWVNTQAYGRVPVAGYVMGYRVYVLAHFSDKKGRFLKKPKLEKRKVWALKQLEVWVPQPAKKPSKKRRYIKGLPGIEGFDALEGMELVRKRLSVEETKAIQIEKLVRKRQIAWLVRAYPEERTRLSEWLKKYAGPKPAHFWPGVDYRLLELW
ncbi:MAG: hypothetical protein N3E49_08325 [Bacteroidia bacterium]|nr:hypothetical protein [Bacteroidia bacterium]